ncbi:hypothetical protein C8F01DRAFT_1373327 [Mycena amicta]|nr:hypothetical protein C8F01DRAFT_1373327 [Mycena amicta]
MFPPELVDSVLSHLRDGSPTLRTCSLSLSDRPIGWLRGIALRGSADILVANLVDFEVLERIRLVGLAEGYTQICGLPALLGITSLYVEMERFASFACFASLLANLPSLNKLAMRRVSLTRSPASLRLCVPTHTSQARSLHLDFFELDVLNTLGNAELLEWLSSGSDGTLFICSHIRIHLWNRDGAEKLVPYLYLVGDNLKSIHLASPYSESIPSLDFSRFSQLKILRIAILSSSVHSWREFISTGLPNLWMRAVSQSRTIESLVLDVTPYPVTIRRLTPYDIEPLASALRPLDSRIRRIQFNVRCEGHGVDVEGNLSPGHFDSTGSTGMGGTCEAENVFRAYVLDRLSLRSPERCTLRLADSPMDLEL